MADANNNQFVHHPKDHGAIGPFVPAEPTPLYYCGLPAFVKQSRHPTCHCGVSALLTTPNQRGIFTAFYRYGLPDYRGFPSYDFEEYNYGPKSHWSSEYEFAEFQAGIKPWPCTKMSDHKCKCGIKAREGVVPSELGHIYYCGNAYGRAVGRTCNWEDFPGRGELIERLKIHSPLEKDRKHWMRLEKQIEEAYDFKEAEDKREMAFFHRHLRRLFPVDAPNDGHIPAPMEEDDDDDDEHDHDDDE
ncbi:unnamed protein product [Miscanthus lutarioriparius]|uniref:Uncharacterized protein n=1 Tax=Miscanthus lutarioriparius TaxID=422564 RepID=A0A811PI04_9POAL|nr:unnamed protein product [Miscanthus lutarioriparius]